MVMSMKLIMDSSFRIQNLARIFQFADLYSLIISKMFANERKQLKDCKIGLGSTSSIASSTSSTSRIFRQAIDDTLASRGGRFLILIKYYSKFQ